jgi:sugar fermentation stimulation protein A
LSEEIAMRFQHPLIQGELVKRYKRFLADVRLESGELVTAHTANSGSMKGLTDPGNPVYLSYHDKPGRKLKYSWEIVKVGEVAVGINTSLPNLLVAEAIGNGTIRELQGYSQLRREVKYGKNSRVDILLSDGKAGQCYVEVKNVTLVENDVAYFPDAVTERGRKHLVELMDMVGQGNRAVIFFVLQRRDGRYVAPADHIDPGYGKTLREAERHGVELLGYRAQVTPESIHLVESIPAVAGAYERGGKP